MAEFFPAGDPRNWFSRKRYGLFVHWGIYSVGGIHEQEEARFRRSKAEYERYAAEFNPQKFNPAEWLDMAEECGMEYLVFTAKHHDGFCMWDTRETDFNIMNTPYGKDVLGMLAEECHKRNFPLVLYYSCVDWHEPSYPNIGRHHEIMTDPAKHDMNRYMEFLKRQIHELCTRYGTIHGFWWDQNVPEWQDVSVNAMIRELQPQAVINNRGYDNSGDFSTPERNYQTLSATPFTSPTEACDSVGMNSWGYRKEEDYFSVLKLERQIAAYQSLGGNFLLNAGPKPDGRFPVEAVRILKGMGTWYRKVRSALTATPCAEAPFFCDKLAVTSSPDRKELYLILLAPPDGEALTLKGLGLLPESAFLLNTRESFPVTLDPTPYMPDGTVWLRIRKLPAERMTGEIPVIRLEFSEPVRFDPLFTGNGENSGAEENFPAVAVPAPDGPDYPHFCSGCGLEWKRSPFMPTPAPRLRHSMMDTGIL